MNNHNQQYLKYTSNCKNTINNPTNSYYGSNIIPSSNNGKETCTNSGFNFGISSRLQYDNDYITEDIEQSVAPIESVLDPNRVKNCSQCLSLNGPRPSHNGWGNSIPIANPSITPAQDLVDIDSIMSNRNVKQTRSKKGMVNDIDVFKFKTYDATLCDKGLDPLSSILTYPKQLYREMSINRFYDLNINPQLNMYYNGAINSQLEAKDNYDYPYPYFLNSDDSLPNAIPGQAIKPKTTCKANCNTNVLKSRLDVPIIESDSDLSDSDLSDPGSDSDYY